MGCVWVKMLVLSRVPWPGGTLFGSVYSGGKSEVGIGRRRGSAPGHGGRRQCVQPHDLQWGHEGLGPPFYDADYEVEITHLL